jgi:opacity protein-like surface antigen
VMVARSLTALLACTGALAGAAAQAADNGIYLGAGVSQNDYGLRGALDDRDTGYKLIAGLRLLDSFGLELNHADHGKARLPSGVACVALVGVDCPDTTYMDATTTTGYAVGFLDFPLVDLFAKAGLSYTDARVRTPGLPEFGASDSSTNFAWGAGAQLHLGSLGLRAEYERLRGFDGRSLGVVSASFVYTFL